MTQATTLTTQARHLQQTLQQVMRCFGRQCRGQGKVLLRLVRETELQLLEVGQPILEMAQAAQVSLQHAAAVAERQRERLTTQRRAALVAHAQSRTQPCRLIHGKPRRQCKIVHAYDPAIAPVLQGKSNCPAPFGRKPGMIAEPMAGFIFATHVPVGKPRDASYVLPLVGKVQHAIKRVTVQAPLALHSLAGALALNDSAVRQARHARGIRTVGMPRTIAPINPSPTPEEVLDLLNAAGRNRKRTPSQVHLTRTCGYSRPVVESYMASLLARGAGQLHYKGPQGAIVQLGMTVMAHNGATLTRIRPHRLSKRAQKFRRLLRLRRQNVKQFNDPKN